MPSTWDLMDRNLSAHPPSGLIENALYVSPYQTIDQLLPVPRGRDGHKAIAVDEPGSAVGTVTMEDIQEGVVGEIDVGYDFEECLPRRGRIFEEVDRGAFPMDSRPPVSKANEALGADLPAKECHTVGGPVTARLRHIPEEGEYIIESGIRFTVRDATEQTIVKVRAEPNASARA